MNCPKNAEIFLDYCAQTLPPLQTAEIDVHLKQCAGCSLLVEAQKEVWEALEAWTPVPVSIHFDARLYARIAEEQSAPAWQRGLRRIFQPPVPYPLWKSAVPLVAACAVLAAGLALRMSDATDAPQHPLHADKVNIEQVEQTLEDFDILTPAVQTQTGAM